MSTVSTKTAKKIGLIGSIALLIGSVIGIGIFFKNDTVFRTNNGNGIGVLISWILASIIAFCTALSFAEIGFGKRKGAGLAGSMEAMYGQKAGRFINFNQNFFYYGILNLSIALFSAEAIFNLVPEGTKFTNNLHIGFVFLLGIGLLAIFLIFNYLSVKWSTRFQVLASSLKFFPLIAVAIAGLVFGIQNPDKNLFIKNSPTENLSFNSIIISLPGILFAFDSFLSIGTIKNEMRDARKQVPLTIIIGMIIVIIFYLFVTVGQIFAGVGAAPDLFDKIFENNEIAKQVSSSILNIFILVSIIGVLNSLILTGLRSFEQSIKSRLFYGYWLFDKIIQKHDDKLKSGIIIASITYCFWLVIILIPSVIINTDAFIDGISNFPTLFMFGVYGTIVLKGLINRAKKIEPEQKVKGFWFVGIISVIGCYLVFGYLFFWEYTFSLITDFNKMLTWGLFISHDYETPKWVGSIWFMGCLIFFIVAPLINDALLKNRYQQLSDKFIISSIDNNLSIESDIIISKEELDNVNSDKIEERFIIVPSNLEELEILKKELII